MLRILRLGFNVLWSDIDIYWKINPLPGILHAIDDDQRRRARLTGRPADPADIAIQSNAPPTERADNGLRRINSCFYFVSASPRSLAAFAAIVQHANRSRLSEQPSFYAVLCGPAAEHIDDGRACEYPGLPVRTPAGVPERRDEHQRHHPDLQVRGLSRI